mmetsp:Transcript_8756/g.14563  ORF Transcript_8756/g.14563 Transcript_8756/m.14563 type:complete len:124 (-) Transcript_8756:123-494(-)
MSADDIANAFVNHYYTTLDTNPTALGSLYSPQSVLTFEGNKFEGPDAIMNKYVSLGKVSHNIPMLTKDVQLSTSNSAMLIFVTGQLKIGEEGNPLLFSHVFQLVATGPGAYYVHNEIFRLIYA